MSKNFSLNQLTEGIRQRHLGLANRRLIEKWSRTGLLRGLEGVRRENMAMLMENQASQLLRESNSLGDGGGTVTNAGDIRGFTNIAFPIVRRVFGGLVANDLVSIQPMSLPSGLLFYLDYAYGSGQGAAASQVGATGQDASSTYTEGDSIYNSPNGANIAAGSDGQGGQYDLAGSGFSKVHEQIAGATAITAGVGGFSGGNFAVTSKMTSSGVDALLTGFDPALMAELDDQSGSYVFVVLPVSSFANMDITLVKDLALTNSDEAGAGVPDDRVQSSGNLLHNVRRLNRVGDWDAAAAAAGNNPWTPNHIDPAHIMTVCNTTALGNDLAVADVYDVSFVLSPNRVGDADSTGSSLVIPAFESNFGTGDTSPVIPEIDIKIESVAVTAATRKLRARWSPELAQDLNAYHSLDAEVELTQILSEQIALEIDREILNDLLVQAKGANLHWSRVPGNFLNKETGAIVTNIGAGPSFTGTVREWYETLAETIIDCANTIHRKTLRGSANFIVVGPDVATILEASVLYRPSYSLDGDGQVGAPFTLGCEKAGTLSNRFTVYKDPYFPRNKILVGYKGGSYLETGYVYAPYVPLIVTPTIFAPEDFTPRKGVMTRYGKKMVRADFYGTVTVQNLNII
jgi:hypothetical protein